MKHYILAKFKEGCDVRAMVDPITSLFEETLDLPGVHGVTVKPCCIDRPNRYDLMIVIDMEKTALESYDVSQPHKTWKQTYGDMLEAKAIFDSEE